MAYTFFLYLCRNHENTLLNKKHWKLISVVCTLALTLFNSLQAYASNLPDSVQTRLDTLSIPNQASYLNQYAMQTYVFDKHLALQASAQAIELAKTNELVEEIAKGWNIQGIVYGAYREMDSSFNCYAKALQISEQNSFEELVMRVTMNTASNHFYLGDYEKAINSYHQALNTLERDSNAVGVAFACANLGLCHIRLENYQKAVNYLKRALIVYQQMNMTDAVKRTINGLGSAYLEVNVDSAIYYFEQKGLPLFEANDRSTLKGLMQVNLGIAYSYKKLNQKAFGLFDKAYSIALDAEDISGQITALINIGRVHNELGSYETALEYFLPALDLVQSSGEQYTEIRLIEMMVLAYRETGNYQEALSLLQERIQLKDSLYTLESSKHIEELEAQYASEKKGKELALNEAQLAKAQTENQRKTIWIIILVSSILLIGLLALLVFKAYQQRQQKKATAANEQLRRYAIQIEQLRASINLQLDQSKSRVPLEITEQDLNDYLIDPLSEREAEVLQKVAAGKTNKQAAEELFVSVSTIKFHLSNIYIKLDVHNRTEALAKASAMNLIVSTKE